MKVWKRKDRNVWIVDYRDKSGKRVRMVGGKTEEAAYLTFAKRQIEEAAAPVTDADLTLNDYATRWLKAVKPDLAQRTHQSYARLFTRHILPTLGPLTLRGLRRRDVTQLLAEKRRTLGRNTVRLIKATLSTMLAHAVDADLLEVNRAAGRFKAQGKTEGAPDIHPMSRAQLAQFTQTMDTLHTEGRLPLPLRAYFAILSSTGMRPGEVLALQVGDLDLSRRKISVERALDLDGSDKPTKTSITRSVDCSETLAALLTDYVSWLTVEALPDGHDPLKLFSGMTHRQIQRGLTRLLTLAGLPHFSPYDLRHTYASLLLSANVPLLYVAERLGHAKPTTTLKHYSKWMPDGDQNFSHLLLGTELAPRPEMRQKPQEMAPRRVTASQRPPVGRIVASSR